MALKVFTLTYVVYEDNLFGVLFAMLTFVPFVLFIGIVTLTVFQRNVEAAFSGFGLMVSTLVNKLLKELIRQPRPHTTHRHDFGMPSDHSQFVFFFSSYIILLIGSSKMPSYVKFFHMMYVLPCALLVMYSRVQLGVHSWAQVFVGALVGLFLGVFWHFVGESIRPKFPLIRSYFSWFQKFVSLEEDTSSIMEVKCDQVGESLSQEFTEDKKID